MYNIRLIFRNWDTRMSDDSNQAMATPPPAAFPQENQGPAPVQQPQQPQQQAPVPQQQQLPQQVPMQGGPSPSPNMQGMPGQTGPIGAPTGPVQGGQNQGYQQQGGTGQPNVQNIDMLHKVIDIKQLIVISNHS